MKTITFFVALVFSGSIFAAADSVVASEATANLIADANMEALGVSDEQVRFCYIGKLATSGWSWSEHDAVKTLNRYDEVGTVPGATNAASILSDAAEACVFGS